MDDTFVRKVTFSRELTDKDFSDIREMLGNKVVQEGARYVIAAFDDNKDYLAFMIATGHVTMTNVWDGKCL